jgi:hypothetical protein
MIETYYKKVGIKYVPVSMYDTNFDNSFSEGCTLVVTLPGHSIRKYNIDPEFAPLIAAATFSRDAISKALRKGLEMRPSQQPITEEQKLAWIKLSEAFGDECHPLQFPSIYDAVESGLNALVKEAAKRLENPAVKAAYDNFMLVYQLTE